MALFLAAGPLAAQAPCDSTVTPRDEVEPGSHYDHGEFNLARKRVENAFDAMSGPEDIVRAKREIHCALVSVKTGMGISNAFMLIDMKNNIEFPEEDSRLEAYGRGLALYGIDLLEAGRRVDTLASALFALDTDGLASGFFDEMAAAGREDFASRAAVQQQERNQKMRNFRRRRDKLDEAIAAFLADPRADPTPMIILAGALNADRAEALRRIESGATLAWLRRRDHAAPSLSLYDGVPMQEIQLSVDDPHADNEADLEGRDSVAEGASYSFTCLFEEGATTPDSAGWYRIQAELVSYEGNAFTLSCANAVEISPPRL